MAAREEHLFIDQKHLGKTFNEVHEWLDFYYRTKGGLHRGERHHREAVEEVRQMWGDEAAKSAELHITLDMGHVPTKEQWQKRTSSTMDSMGRPVDYLDRFHNCDDEKISVAFHMKLPCKACERETDQRLTGVHEGRFYCSICRGSNHHPDYRLDQRPRY